MSDPAGDRVFGMALRKDLDPAIDVVEVDAEINSREFAGAVVRAFSEAQQQYGKFRSSDRMRKVEFVDQTIRDAQQSCGD